MRRVIATRVFLLPKSRTTRNAWVPENSIRFSWWRRKALLLPYGHHFQLWPQLLVSIVHDYEKVYLHIGLSPMLGERPLSFKETFPGHEDKIVEIIDPYGPWKNKVFRIEKTPYLRRKLLIMKHINIHPSFHRILGTLGDLKGHADLLEPFRPPKLVYIQAQYLDSSHMSLLVEMGYYGGRRWLPRNEKDDTSGYEGNDQRFWGRPSGLWTNPLIGDDDEDE